MIRIIEDLAIARQTILRRLPTTEAPLPPRIRDGIRAVFGRELTVKEVARTICEAVAAQGDTAVRDFSARIDGFAPDDFVLDVADTGRRARADRSRTAGRARTRRGADSGLSYARAPRGVAPNERRRRARPDRRGRCGASASTCPVARRRIPRRS